MEPISENPYAAPQTFDAQPDHSSNAELIRKEHLSVETSIKSLGFLYCLISIAVIRVSFSFLSQYKGALGGVTDLAEPAIGAALLALAVFQFITGVAIRKLKRWSRIAAIILSGVGLLAFPIGTLISGYILYLLLNRKGQMVFSARYKEVIAATPNLKYRTSKTVWIASGAVIIAIIAVFFAVILG